jgi:hypothetical protein
MNRRRGTLIIVVLVLSAIIGVVVALNTQAAFASDPVVVPAGLTLTPEPPTPTPASTPIFVPTRAVVIDEKWNIAIYKPKGVTSWIWIPWMERQEGQYTGPE